MKRSLLILFVLLVFASCSDNFYDNSLSMYDYSGIYFTEEGQSEKYTDYGENPFVKTSEEHQSTFGIDADGGAYSNMRRYVNFGQLPPPEAVRVEEFINYFTYDYNDPENENVSISTEATVCPWNKDHLLMRIGLKGKSMDASELGPSNFVFLIDVSGSMGSPDKLELLKNGFKMLVDEMDENDRIAIVTYASSDKVILESTACDEKSRIKRAIDKLGSGGSTAGAKGIETAYEIALENFISEGNNRVIIGSDGDFNVGPSTDDELVELIEEKRELGIFLTVLGVGQGNLNDSMMEKIANHGNGNYEYIDNIDQLKKVFVYEKQKFYTVAKDCKIQVTFNESSIDSFRLIGYENRVLNNEDFEKDTVDAGEIGAGQTITAFYELVPLENPSGEFCSIQFRYKMPEEDNSRLIDQASVSSFGDFDVSSSNMKFGVAVTGLGLLMKESVYSGNLTYQDIINWAKESNVTDQFGFNSEFIELAKTASSFSEL